LLLSVGLVLFGGLYLVHVSGSSDGSWGVREEPFEPGKTKLLERKGQAERFRTLMAESVLEKFEPGTEFYLKIDDESYKILPRALDLSEVLSTQAGIKEAEDGRVELDLRAFFFGRNSEDEDVKRFADWAEEVEPEDIKLFVDLLEAVARVTPSEDIDLSKFRNASLEQLSRLIMLADFFGATMEKRVGRIILPSALEVFASFFARKIEPEINEKTLKEFFAGKENILSKIVDGLPKGPSRILVDELFSKQKAFFKPISFPFQGAELLAGLPGGRLVVGAWGQKSKIWDVSTGKVLKTLDHSLDSSVVALSNEKIAGIFFNGGHRKVGIWDTSTGKKLKTLDATFPKQIAVLSSERLAIAFATQTFWDLITEHMKIGVWDVSNGKRLKSEDAPGLDVGFPNMIAALSYKKLAIIRSVFREGNLVSKVQTWDVYKGKSLKTLDVPELPVGVVALEDEKVAVQFLTNEQGERTLRKVEIWDAFTGEKIRPLGISLRSRESLVGLLGGKLAAGIEGKGRGNDKIEIRDALTGKMLGSSDPFGRLVKLVGLSDGRLVVEFMKDRFGYNGFGVWDLLPFYKLYKNLNFEQALLVKYLVIQNRAGKIVEETEKFEEIYESLPERTTKLLHKLDLYFSEFEELIIDKPEPSDPNWEFKELIID